MEQSIWRSPPENLILFDYIPSMWFVFAASYFFLAIFFYWKVLQFYQHFLAPKRNLRFLRTIIYIIHWDANETSAARVNLFNHNFSKVVEMFLNFLNNTDWRVPFRVGTNRLLSSPPSGDIYSVPHLSRAEHSSSKQNDSGSKNSLFFRISTSRLFTHASFMLRW